jgi:hypothetical protein
MARRAFDLSGDLRIDHDPLYESIFQLETVFLEQIKTMRSGALSANAADGSRLIL